MRNRRPAEQSSSATLETRLLNLGSRVVTLVGVCKLGEIDPFSREGASGPRRQTVPKHLQGCDMC